MGAAHHHVLWDSGSGRQSLALSSTRAPRWVAPATQQWGAGALRWAPRDVREHRCEPRSPSASRCVRATPPRGCDSWTCQIWWVRLASQDSKPGFWNCCFERLLDVTGKKNCWLCTGGLALAYLSRFGGLTQLMKQREVDLTLPLIWWNPSPLFNDDPESNGVLRYTESRLLMTVLHCYSYGRSKCLKILTSFQRSPLEFTKRMVSVSQILLMVTRNPANSPVEEPVVEIPLFTVVLAPFKRWFSRRICWTIDSSLNLCIPPNGKNKNHLKKTSPWEKDMLLPRRVSIFVHGIPWLSPHLQCCSCRSIHLVSGHVVLENSWKNPGSFRGNKHDLYIPRAQMTPIFEGQPSKRRPFPIKTAGFQVYIPLKVNGWFI